ncbi:hypothetical protein [Herbiconiux sp.]|uniref:hypothetical protein n=1 Tax=Herbiconiux sp. TaxID=1871186 RepID=UPI0025C44BA0|nr:hypothetical protein [Herbiconiux sp.]
MTISLEVDTVDPARYRAALEATGNDQTISDFVTNALSAIDWRALGLDVTYVSNE